MRNIELFSSTVSMLSSSLFWATENSEAPMPAMTKAINSGPWSPMKSPSGAPFQVSSTMPNTHINAPATARQVTFSFIISVEISSTTTVCTGQITTLP